MRWGEAKGEIVGKATFLKEYKSLFMFACACVSDNNSQRPQFYLCSTVNKLRIGVAKKGDGGKYK